MIRARIKDPTFHIGLDSINEYIMTCGQDVNFNHRNIAPYR